MSIVCAGRSLLLGVAFVAANAEAVYKYPEWNASSIYLSQYLHMDPNDVAERLSECEVRTPYCEEMKDSAILIFLAKTNLPAAVRVADRMLANPDNAELAISRYAAQVLAISGKPQPLLLQTTAVTLKTDAWALAKGGNYSLADVIVGPMAAQFGSQFCWVSVYADPFLGAASPVRDAVLNISLARIAGTNPYASQCAADLLIRSNQQLDVDAISRVSDNVLLLLSSSEASRQIRGAELAAVLLPRLSRSEELASTLVRAVVNADSWPVWYATSTVAAANGLVGTNLPIANESVRVNPKLATLTVGDRMLKSIPFLVQEEFARGWPSFLPDIDDMQLAELIHAIARSYEGLTDRTRKIQYLLGDDRVKQSYVARLAAVTSLSEELPEQTRALSKGLIQESNALQRTTLETKSVKPISAAQAKDDWKSAMSSDNPWLRLAALCNAAERCHRGVPSMAGEAQTNSSIVAYNKLIEASLEGCQAL